MPRIRSWNGSVDGSFQPVDVVRAERKPARVDELELPPPILPVRVGEIEARPDPQAVDVDPRAVDLRQRLVVRTHRQDG